MTEQTIDKRGNILIKDGRLLFRNFTGMKGEYNAQGERNFCIILEPSIARRLQSEGWNVRSLPPREEGDEEIPYMKVNVKYKNRQGNPVRQPPEIEQISSRGRTYLDEESVNGLDTAEIEKVNLRIRPYSWDRDSNGREKIAAYLVNMYVKIVDDPLEMEYFDAPENDVALPGDWQCPKCGECNGTGQCGHDV